MNIDDQVPEVIRHEILFGTPKTAVNVLCLWQGVCGACLIEAIVVRRLDCHEAAIVVY